MEKNGRIDVLNIYILGIINIIGMYIIPIILSIILFGYIYKKTSIDFINSMPVTRKTIFTSNYLLGILIIFLIQILTLGVYLVFSKIPVQIVIIPQMALDLFIYMLISYIFVFSISMLSMTLSGNILTQIVLTILFAFLMPFLTVIFTEFGENSIVNLNGTTKIIECNEKINYYFTAPSNIFLGESMSSGMISSQSEIKMVLLSIMSFILGLLTFKKRKMENLHSSFASNKVHLFVKGLTLIPLVFIIIKIQIQIHFEMVRAVIDILLAFIYYIIFDFITRKNIKFRYNIGAFILSVMLIAIIYFGLDFANDIFLKKDINIDDIVGIGIDPTSIIINDIMKELIDPNEKLSIKYYNENDELNTLITNSKIVNMFKKGLARRESPTNISVSAKIKLRNNKEMYIETYMYEEAYDEMINKINRNAECIEQYNNLNRIKGNIYISNNRVLSKEVSKQINNYKAQNKLEFNVDTNNNTRNFNMNVGCYTYKNHHLIEKYINSKGNEEIFQLIINDHNKFYIEKIKDVGLENIINIRIDHINHNIILNDIYDTGSHYVSYNELFKYLQQLSNISFDINKDYYIIECITYNSKFRNMIFYINPNKELLGILKKMTIK